MRFDWIDFGVSWKSPAKLGFNGLQHTSTASELSRVLRGRSSPYRKVFCWLSHDLSCSENTPGVRHIESIFPGFEYELADEGQKLEIFAAWLIDALMVGAPELLIEGEEKLEILSNLATASFTYVRKERAPGDEDSEPCGVRYVHSPGSLAVEVAHGRGAAKRIRLLTEPFRPDELSYAKAIIGCSQHSDKLAVKSRAGWL